MNEQKKDMRGGRNKGTEGAKAAGRGREENHSFPL